MAEKTWIVSYGKYLMELSGDEYTKLKELAMDADGRECREYAAELLARQKRRDKRGKRTSEV